MNGKTDSNTEVLFPNVANKVCCSSNTASNSELFHFRCGHLCV